MSLIIMVFLQPIEVLWPHAKFHYKQHVRVVSSWYSDCYGSVEDIYPGNKDYDVAVKRTQDCKPEDRLTKYNESELEAVHK